MCIELKNQRFAGLISHLNTMKTLLRQGMPIRGKTDQNSNIHQFNLDKSRSDKNLDLFMRENKYFSHEILNEQEQLIILNARRTLVNEINEHAFYSIICDESCEISKCEQLSFSVRTCSEDFNISENTRADRHPYCYSVNSLLTLYPIINTELVI